VLFDAVLRMTWIAALWRPATAGAAAAVSTLLAALEVSRRCVWCFYRVENEHVANTNHLRATVAVALPQAHLVGVAEAARSGWAASGAALRGVGRRPQPTPEEADEQGKGQEEAPPTTARARAQPRGEHFNWSSADEAED
jgi:hypothetical protein